MKSLIITTLILFSGILKGQETKTIIKYFHKSKQIMEMSDVLVANENIKHGQFVRYYRDEYYNIESNKGQYIQTQGNYFQNKKDSTWIYYKGHKLLKEENYTNGKKTGIWKTYLENGQVVKRYNYDMNQEIEPIIQFYYIYPDRASDAGIEGIVEIYVKYNLDCKTDTIYVTKRANELLENSALRSVYEFEKLREKYSLRTDCSEKTDSTYVINYKLR